MNPVSDSKAKKTVADDTPIIELEISQSHVWVWRGADVELVSAIIGALKDAG